jgi:ATP-dependent Lon protease
VSTPPSPPQRSRRPLVGLVKTVLFPREVATVEVHDPANLTALGRMNALDGQVVAVPLRGELSLPHARRFQPVGTLARVVSRTSLPAGGARIVLQGLRRVRLTRIEEVDGCFWSRLERLDPPTTASPEARATRTRLIGLLDSLARADTSVSPELPGMVTLHGDNDDRISDLVGGVLGLSRDERAQLLAEADPARRMTQLVRILDAALVRVRAGAQIEGRVAERVRRRYLRTKLNELKRELGERSAHEIEIERFAERIERLALTEPARAAALRSLDQLRHSAAASAAAARTRGHLEWMLELPWGPHGVGEPLDFEAVEATLTRGHFGMSDVKQRVAEFLAVRQLGGTARGTVLCFVGPPGTGKSTMGRAVANALGRPLLSIPVGAMVHEHELTGLPHELPNGTPGAILAGIHRTGTSDPVVLLDEIDKLALGGEGQAAGALLSLLDPETNSEFLDHYLGVPFDLSNCLFLATASEASSIPDALFDRMEKIEFPGYSEAEKFELARRHIMPRAREHAGLRTGQLQVSQAALRSIIRGYTEEAGVRQLQRHLLSLARKAAVQVVRGGKALKVRREDLVELLGPRTVEEDLRVRRPAVGVATGLAWTSAGGSLLPIEALKIPGVGRLILTGSLGDVLRESVQTAASYVRTCCTHLGFDPEAFDVNDLHLHLPAAAVPKDGPSAGVAIAVAIVSLMTDQPIRHDVAMTGEMSLMGQVLGVGGVREKLLAAIRAGFKEVILPARNADDCLRLDPEIRARLRIHPIEDVRQAIEIAIMEHSREEPTLTIERIRGKRAAGDARHGA